MPTINFPSSPTLNQEYSYNSKTWRWNGTGWALTLGKPYGREVLSADRTYYVATTGSDSADGLTVGTPFLTIQKAIDIAAALDTSIYNIFIVVANGTYGAFSNKKLIGAGSITVIGDVTTPANVLINAASGAAITNSYGGWLLLQGLKIAAAASFGLVNNGAVVKIDRVDFGVCSTGHMYVAGGGVISAFGNYTISGSAPVHVQAGSAGEFACISKTITITGTPAFSLAYFYASVYGRFVTYSNTYSGSATGKRYDISSLSLVFVNGAGTSILPGSIAGTTATGAQYI